MPNTAKSIDNQALDTLFRKARTLKAWEDRPVTDAQVKELYDLLKWGPTSANCSPARFIFVKGQAAKERLKPHLDKGNVTKTMTAPVTAIIAYDYDFYTHTDKLAPHNPSAVRAMWEGNELEIKDTAYKNGTLQGGYLIMAARAIGLDCGPMSGFDPAGVKKEFFPDKNWKANFLVNIGYGDWSSLFPRAPRFDFDEVCEIL